MTRLNCQQPNLTHGRLQVLKAADEEIEHQSGTLAESIDHMNSFLGRSG